MGRRRSKKHFTIVELFLSLSILALIGGIVLINSKPMFDYYQFNRNISHLTQEIDFTRRLSRIAHADIEFYIEQKKEGLMCQRTTDEPIRLPHTFHVPIFIPSLQIKEKKVKISFTSSGWIREETECTIYCKNQNKTFVFSAGS